MVSVAAGFKTIASEYAIRPATRNTISKAIKGNRARMV